MAHKILLADDSVTVQKIITLTFSDEGVDVETVNNGDEAINKLQYMRPSLVMVDVSIPGKDGYQVCEYIKTHPDLSKTPVILLVPAFEPFDNDRARQIGADHHMTKPFQSIRSLISTVKNLIESEKQPIIPQAEVAVEEELVLESDNSEDVLSDSANVVDMTSRFQSAQISEDDLAGETISENSEARPGPIRLTQEYFHVVEEFEDVPPTVDIYAEDLDRVLDLDDVLPEAGTATSELTAGPGQSTRAVVQMLSTDDSQPDQQTQSYVISQKQIDEIVDRVVAQVTDNLFDRLSGEIAQLIAPESSGAADRDDADEEVTHPKPDSLELDEL